MLSEANLHGSEVAVSAGVVVGYVGEPQVADSLPGRRELIFSEQ